MVALFLVCIYFVMFCFLFCLQTMKKHRFPCHSVFFKSCRLKGSLVLQFHAFVLVCFSCVVCFHFKQLVCIILCLCCVFFLFSGNRMKWFSCLHLVVLFPFWLFCFEILFVFASSFLSPDTAKTDNSAKLQKKMNQNKIS